MNVLAFDCFGTVFDTRALPPADLHEYGRQIRRPNWEPFDLPRSFYNLLPHPDAVEGLARLREQHFIATLSNAPIELLIHLSTEHKIGWDAMIPFECAKVCKPNPRAYDFAIEYLGVVTMRREAVTFVTANPTFGDVEGAHAVGAYSQVIRQEGCPADLIALAQKYGC